MRFVFALVARLQRELPFGQNFPHSVFSLQCAFALHWKRMFCCCYSDFRRFKSGGGLWISFRSRVWPKTVWKDDEKFIMDVCFTARCWWSLDWLARVALVLDVKLVLLISHSLSVYLFKFKKQIERAEGKTDVYLWKYMYVQGILHLIISINSFLHHLFCLTFNKFLNKFIKYIYVLTNVLTYTRIIILSKTWSESVTLTCWFNFHCFLLL